MKKDYDFFVSKRNTPHLDLYTKLIGSFYFFVGTNFVLSFFYAKYHLELREEAICCLVLGLLMYSMIYDKTTDPLKGNRDLFTVVANGVVHAIWTFFMVYWLSFWALVIVYIIEMIYIIIVILKYFKPYKKQGKGERKRRCNGMTKKLSKGTKSSTK